MNKIALFLGVCVATATAITLLPRTGNPTVVGSTQAQAFGTPEPVPRMSFACLTEPVNPLREVPWEGQEDTEVLLNIMEVSLNAMRQIQPMSVHQEQIEIRDAIFAEEAMELYSFTTNYPASSWTPSIQTKLGQYFYNEGRYSLSLETLAQAWENTKSLTSREGSNTADEALVNYLSLLAKLGRYETLVPLFAETAERRFRNAAHSGLYLQTREAFVHMGRNSAKGYRCGTLALANVMLSQGGNQALARQFERIPSPANGFSLSELQQFAQERGMNMVPVSWGETPGLVIPSVIHWNENHYAAVVDQVGNRYGVVDPTFGHKRYLTLENILAEASGAFLVPSQQVPGNWQRLSSNEAASIYGRGYADTMDDGCDQPGCPDGKGNGGGGPGGGGSGGGGCRGGGSCLTKNGMPDWAVSQPYINLWLFDTPLSYQPALGNKPMAVEMVYKQRSYGTYIDNTFIGNQWCTKWHGVGQATYHSVYIDIYSPEGAVTHYTFSSSLTSNTDYHNGSYGVRTVDGSGNLTGMTIYYPDGSQDVYGFAPTNYYGNASKIYLSKRIDPQGHSIEMTFHSYDPSFPRARIDQVIDPDGNAVTFTYDTTYDTIVTEITDHAGRSVEFTYDGAWLDLVAITDAAGITSEIVYDAYHLPLELITPYGTTEFEYFNYREDHSERRFITITEPNGAKQRYLFDMGDFNSPVLNPYTVNPTEPSGTPYGTFSEYFGDHNSYHWDARAFEQLSSNFKTAPASYDYTISDTLVGHWKHWLVSPIGSAKRVDTLAFERLPSPDGTTEGLKTWYDHEDKDPGDQELSGSHIKPAVIARVMPDSTTWYEYLQYNDLGNLTNKIEKWVDGGNTYYRTNKYIYDSNGYDLLVHIGPGNHVEAGYAYSGSHPGRPIRMTNAVDEVTTYTYDGYDRLSTVLTPTGLLSTYTYGGDAYVESIVDSVGGTPVRTNSYTWDDNYLRTHTDPRGFTVTNTYDGLGRLTRTDYPGSSYEEQIYYIFPGTSYADSTGGTNIIDRTGFRDRLGNWTYYTWTANRQMSTVTNTLGTITAYGYCDCGSLSSVTNAFGLSLQSVTTYAYDEAGRRVLTTVPDVGSSITNEYDTLNRLTVVRQSFGSTTNIYDNLGRLKEIRNAAGLISKSVYDSENNVLQFTDNNGVLTTNLYDNLHRVLTKTYPDGGVEQFGYTANYIRPTSYTNQLNHVMNYTHDASGRKTKEVQVGIFTNTFTYSPANDLLTLTDGRSKTTTWAYDTEGRVSSKKEHGNVNAILTYAYDANGRLTNRWSTAKGNTKYQYNAAGNLTSVDYYSSTDLTYSYDALSRLTNMVDAAGTTKYTYNAFNAVLTEDGPWSDDILTYTYTNVLRSGFSLQQASGSWTNGFVYDASRRLTNVLFTGGTFTYLHDGDGVSANPAASTMIQRLTLANTSYITNTFDGVSRMASTSLKTSGHTTRNSHAYLYNLGGQRTNHVFTDGSYANYTYDAAGQVFTDKAYTSGGSAKTDEQLGYRYDAGWNMLQRTNNGAVSTFSVNDLNQYTSTPDGSMGYDGNGNISTSHGGNQYWSFSSENQLEQVYYYNNFKSIFVYDGKMRLRKRTEQLWDNTYSVWTTTSETRYYYDGMRVIQERNSSNVPTASYVRGLDLSHSFQGAGGIGGLLARTAHSGAGGATLTHAYYHVDGNGNVTAMLDASQNSAASYRYDAFGRLLTSSGTLASANLYRFSSKEFHVKSGTYYYGFRFYNPNLQRWVNRDPFRDIGFQEVMSQEVARPTYADRGNLYEFIENSPLGELDAWGLAPVMKGCKDKEKAAIQKTLKDGCGKAKKCADECDSSEQAKKGVEAMCDSPTLICAGDDEFEFSDKSKCTDLCGKTRQMKDGSKEVFLCPNAFKGTRCGGDLACTVFHEAVHMGGLWHAKEGGSEPKDFKQMEKCMGCK